MKNVKDIRHEFAELFAKKEFVLDKSGCKTVEIINASFFADDETIFGQVNNEYVMRELEWYQSQSLNVNDIPGENPPKIWKLVSDENGNINSNYGYLIWSKKNGYQYEKALNSLLNNPFSRQAVMIYNRPTMHKEWNKNGMSDFICTNCVQYLIRQNKMHAIVSMRSNDAWAGYRNDFAWQETVLTSLCYDYNTEFVRRSLNNKRKQKKTVIIEDYNPVNIGNIYWNVSSLHVYERQFYLIEHFIQTGEHIIVKK
jgi:thymidylate synthase